MAALTGKVAFVTGSSRGIGAAIAAMFAREGAKVGDGLTPPLQAYQVAHQVQNPRVVGKRTHLEAHRDA